MNRPQTLAFMHSDSGQRNHYIRNAFVFATCLVAVFTLPLIGLFLNSDLLFFAPQLLFPYDALVVFEFEAEYSRSILNDETANILNVLQWVVAGTVYVLFERRSSFGRAVLLSVGTIVAVGFVSQLLLHIFGLSVSLDGP